MLDLGIIEHFIDLVNGSTGYLPFFEKIDPFPGGFLEGHFFNFLIQQFPVFGP